MLYIIIAILIFGILVAVHELGHFTTAKLLGVRVNEFSIGMGPALFSRQRGETKYSLRAFPIGGYCAMEGEDEESDDPRAFSAQAAWKRLIILVSGALMNFLTSLILIQILFIPATAFATPTIAGFAPGFPCQGEEALLPGDTIVRINGERVYLYADVPLLLGRSGGTSDLVIRRDGQLLTRSALAIVPREYEQDGQTVLRYGIDFAYKEATPGAKLHDSWFNAIDFVRLVRLSLTDLLTGNAGLKDLAGPIGIVDTISEVGNQSESFADAMTNILYFGALIAANLAVMNLLPLPALDGGRIFLLLINTACEKIFKKKIPAKYESFVHLAGFVLLIGLMIVVAYNDIARILGR